MFLKKTRKKISPQKQKKQMLPGYKTKQLPINRNRHVPRETETSTRPYTGLPVAGSVRGFQCVPWQARCRCPSRGWKVLKLLHKRVFIRKSMLFGRPSHVDVMLLSLVLMKIQAGNGSKPHSRKAYLNIQD